MPRKRSRAVGGKQGLMSDPHSTSISSSSSSSYSIGNQPNKPRISSVSPPPKFFLGFSSKNFSSVLEDKKFSSIGSLLFLFDRHFKKPTSGPSAENGGGSRAVGLGILNALKDEEGSSEKSPVLFGSSKLKIHVPSVVHYPNTASMEGSLEVVPTSPIEFGIKNKDSQLALLSPAARRSSSPRVLVGSISASEMELSEDYTCVIFHGPNPRTTHIFDDCVVESCGDCFVAAKKENSSLPEPESCPPNEFLSFCDACKKKLGQGKDTFIYRGEKAFCSSECRYRAMLWDESSEVKLLNGSSLTS